MRKVDGCAMQVSIGALLEVEVLLPWIMGF